MLALYQAWDRVTNCLWQAAGEKGGDMFKCKFVVLLALCGALAFSLSPTATLRGSDPIVIGGLFPMTGRLAWWGANILNGAMLAVEQINEHGGVLGRELSLVTADTMADPAFGVAAAERLIQAYGVPVIVGPVASSVTLAVSNSVTIPYEVALISPSAASPEITTLDESDFVFRTTPSEAMQGIALAKAALSKNYGSIAIIARDDSYGMAVAGSLRANFEDLGGIVTDVFLYPPDITDFTPLIVAASEDNPDAISLITYEEGIGLITQMATVGMTNFDLLSGAFKHQHVWVQLCATVGPEVLEDKVGVAWSSIITDAGAKQFINDYRESYGEDPTIYAANAYDTVMAIALAIARAGEVSGVAVRDNLRAIANPPGEVITHIEFDQAFSLLDQGVEINYEGVSGPVDFDEWGDMASGVFEIWRIEDCEVVTQELVEVPGGIKLASALSYLLEDPYNRIAEFPEEIQRQVRDSGTIPVAIWLNAPLPDEIVNRSNEFKESVGEGWSLNEVREWRQEVFEDKSAWYADVEEEVVQFLNTNGFWDEDRSYACLAAPVLYTDLPVDPSERRIFEELQRLNVVDTIYLAGVFEPKLDSAVPTIEAPSVWSRKDSSGNNLRGTNVRIAIVESGRIDFTLAPFASSKRNHITRDSALSSDPHKTAVAEVAASSHAKYTGFAPDAILLSADSKDHTEKELAAAIDWALKKGADVLNASIGEPIPAGKPHSWSRLLDFIVIEHMRAFTTPAGNEGKGAFVCAPASGYNVIAVGGIDDKGTLSWADDTMYDIAANDGSNSKNPISPNNDREKPDVCAVAVGIKTAAYGYSKPVRGTSFAAPAVAGTIGLLIQRQPWLAVWPEVTKAIVMASAIHNVNGPSRLDDWEGAGTIVASEADNIVINNWLWKKVVGKADFPITIKFNANKGETVRFVITWDSHAQRKGGLVTTDKLEADLDLEIFDPAGISVTSSTSSDNSYEIVEFVAAATGRYEARLSEAGFKAAFEYVGAAWHRSAAPHIQFSGGLTRITAKPGKKVNIELRGMPGHNWILLKESNPGTSIYLGVQLDLGAFCRVLGKGKFNANGKATFKFTLSDYPSGQELYLQAISGTGDLLKDPHESNVVSLTVE